MDNNKPNYDIFLSYDSKDIMAVNLLASALRDSGIHIWFDKWELVPGQQWKESIVEAMNQSAILGICIGPSGIGRWSKGIIGSSLSKEGFQSKIIPILLLGANITLIPDTLNNYYFVDFNEGEKAIDKIKWIVASEIEGRLLFHKGSKIIWNVPYRRNPNFLGKKNLINKVRESLVSKKEVALIQVLTGFGGVGKTQLAVEYAFRFAADYNIVWWIRADDQANLAEDYTSLARELGIREENLKNVEVAITAVHKELKRRSSWLLVFDDAGDPEEINKFLPQVREGHIIITSRNPNWNEVASTLSIQLMGLEEATNFLLQRTNQSDRAAAKILSKELGYLPLALEQAGAYIAEGECSIAQYLNLFREQRLELLQRGRSYQEYQSVVATTWEISFRRVEKESPAAADLLNLCSFMAPDDIPMELLEKGAEHLPKRLSRAVNDPLAWNEVQGALRGYSLIEVSDNFLSMHSLVQAVVRERLNNQRKKKWLSITIDLLNVEYSGDFDSEVDKWSWWDRLLPHAMAAARQAETFKLALPAVSRLLNQVGFYLQFRGEYEQAQKVYARSLAIREKILRPNDPKLAIALNNMGTVLHEFGEFEKAKNYFERALAIDEAVYGPNHPDVAVRLNNIGMMLQELGDLEGAKAQYERALAIGEVAYGPMHPKIAIRVNNLGAVLRAMGDLSEAKVQYERALAIDEATYGPNHPEVATDLNNLGFVMKDLGDLAGARANYERALAICLQFFGEDHPKTKLVRKNLDSLTSPKK